MLFKDVLGGNSVLIVNLSSLPALLTAAALLRVAGSPPDTRILLARTLDPVDLPLDPGVLRGVSPLARYWIIGFTPDDPACLEAFANGRSGVIDAIIGGGKEEIWRSVLGDHRAHLFHLFVAPSNDPALISPGAALRRAFDQTGEGMDGHTRGLLENATMAANGTTTGDFSDYFRAAVGWERRALYAIRHFARHSKPDRRIARWIMPEGGNEDESFDGLQSFQIVCGAMAVDSHTAVEITRLTMAIDDAPLRVVSEGYFHLDGRILPYAPLDPAEYAVHEILSVYRGSRRTGQDRIYYFAFPSTTLPELLAISHDDKGPYISEQKKIDALHESTLIWEGDAWVSLRHSQYYAELHRPVGTF